MISQENFHHIYMTLPYSSYIPEELFYKLFGYVFEELKNKTNSNVVSYHEKDIFNILNEEFLYITEGQPKEKVIEMIQKNSFAANLITTVIEKCLYSLLNKYDALSIISPMSPIVTTLDININFIINRMAAIKKMNPTKLNILLDMMSKAFLMFKSINYLLSSGFETEAFSTWRTIHELECVIKVIYDNEYLVPIYHRHMIYNTAFRDEIEDKDKQQSIIDELKEGMKKNGLKSKDMKKYIEYGWLYSIKSLNEKYPDFKLNFRNGLQYVAGLSIYSKDYEMSSEVAHSSPLLIYSNKAIFNSLTIVRSYESFIRLENIFFEFLKKNEEVEYRNYEAIRSKYIKYAKSILKKESHVLKHMISRIKNK